MDDRGRNTPHSALAPTPPLVVRVQAGDTAAYDPLVRRHMRAAFGVAYRILRHRQDAEDVVQEAFWGR